MIVVSGHQPLYLPWLGFIHKLSICDVFIFMDDVQLSDGDFNRRNRVMAPDGKILWLSVPLARKESASLILRDIRIAREGQNKDWQRKHLMTLRSCYGRTAHFKRYLPFFEWLYEGNDWMFLAQLNMAVLKQIIAWFHISARIIIGSEQNFTRKKSDLLLEHALRFNADVLLTGEQGINYVVKEDFEKRSITVVHQKYKHPVYNQGKLSGVAHLSFIDLLFRYGDESLGIVLANNMTRNDLCRK
jgi:hypothetical protein